MTVFDFADALTPFIESLMFFMLFEAFLKRRETLVTTRPSGVGQRRLSFLMTYSRSRIVDTVGA